MTHAKGAGESGLGRLIELHGVNTAGDAMVAVALANTLFFSVPTGEARGRVALYLLITMAPFAVMAPVIGPLLDRFRHGRRYAIATTMLVRCFADLGARRRGGRRRALALPRGVRLPGRVQGVRRHPVGHGAPAAAGGRHPGRRQLPHLAGRHRLRHRSAPALAGLLSLVGPAWSLRAAFLVFGAGMVLALRLPAKVDSTVGETPTTLSLDDTGPIPRRYQRRLRGRHRAAGQRCAARLLRVPAPCSSRSCCARTRSASWTTRSRSVSSPVPPRSATPIGTTIGSRLRTRAPLTVIVVVLAIVTAAALAGALFYGVVTVLAVGFAAGLAQSLGKLSLDAIIQRDVPEAVRTSAFARSETLLQLSWVVGGAIGIVLPLDGQLGLGIAAAGLLGMLVWTARSIALRRREKGQR